MVLNDFITLAKKIAIGIIITLIPFSILFGGLWLTQKYLSPENDQVVNTQQP